MFPSRIYILSHQSGFKAFEDYCLTLQSALGEAFRRKIISTGGALPPIDLVSYLNESEIPDDRSGTVIYLFVSSLPPKFANLHKKGFQGIYLLNMEQSTRPLWAIILRQYLAMGLPLVDYDQYQYQFTRQILPQKQVYYLPYQPIDQELDGLKELLKTSHKNYHVAFCSTNHSKRRLALYQQLEQRGLKVIDVWGWKEARDQLIAQAQILVNVHYDQDYLIFEHIRCDRWIMAGHLVLSETSLSDPLLDCRELMMTAKYEDMVDVIVNLLDQYETVQTTHQAKYQKQFPLIVKQRRHHCRAFVQHLTTP